jgi:16S rRNA (cytosine967-C5)-methyltransferase
MSDEMGDHGVIVACDVRERRMRLLQQTIRLSGAQHSHPVQIATTGPLPFGDSFDRVLVDAPCSGLGTLRRDPDIKWRRQETDLASLADRQLALLHRAAEAVRPGGRLVYATCSSEPEENEQVVDAFLATRPDFTALDLRQTLPAPVATLVDERGALRTSPVHRLEAFFAAAVMRIT